jgi:hypothetical protein
MSHWRIRERQSRREAEYWLRALFFLVGVFAVAAVLAISHLVATWDIIEAEQAENLCAEMVKTFEQSGGEFGWPNCDHLGR